HGLRDERPGLPFLEAALVDGADQLLENRPRDGVEPCLDHDVRDLRLPDEPPAWGSLPGQLRDEELDGAVRAALGELAAGGHERVAFRGAGAPGAGGPPTDAAPEPSVLARRVLLAERRRQRRCLIQNLAVGRIRAAVGRGTVAGLRASNALRVEPVA